jgi:hypothetical protein
MSKQIEAAVVEAPVANSIAKIDMPANLNVSGTIRYLHGSGLTRGQIVKYYKEHLGREIRYQHVRNVLITPLKKAVEA